MNDMDKAQKLIRECRYYKGEERNPYANHNVYRMAWICEKKSGLTWRWMALLKNKHHSAITIFGL